MTKGFLLTCLKYHLTSKKFWLNKGWEAASLPVIIRWIKQNKMWEDEAEFRKVEIEFGKIIAEFRKIKTEFGM